MGLILHQGQQIDAKGGLQRGAFVQFTQNVVFRSRFVQFDHDAHALAVRLVPQVADAFQVALTHQFGDALDQRGLVDLVRQLVDDDAALATAHVLQVHPPADGQFAFAGGISAEQFIRIMLLQDDAAGGKIWSFDKAHQIGNGNIIEFFPAVQHEDQRVDHFGQVVRGNAGGHAHRDARGAIDQQVGHCCRQHFRLVQRTVKVAPEVNRIPVELIKNFYGKWRQAGFGVAHRRGRVAVHAAEIALAVHQHIAHGEILPQARHGFIDSHIAVGMVLAQHLTDDSGGFLERRIRAQSHVVHGIQNPALHGF